MLRYAQHDHAVASSVIGIRGLSPLIPRRKEKFFGCHAPESPRREARQLFRLALLPCLHRCDHHILLLRLKFGEHW
jgi:hypothetical protein